MVLHPSSRLLVFAAFLAVAACSPPTPPPEPCAAAACAADATCTVTGGTASCACNTGFHGDGKSCAKDVVCAETSCPEHATCRVAEGAIACDCATGFVMNPGKTSCDPVDPCASKTCGANSHCAVAPGAVICACDDGFSLDADEVCQPVKVCTTCGTNAHCGEVTGGSACLCDAGFHDESGACVDDDECALGTATCGANSHCANALGSWDCPCNTGFHAESGACVDDDECTLNTFTCAANMHCVNGLGSYACACDPGFRLDDTGACVDVDECAGTNPCDTFGTCHNTAGSFTCECPDGLRVNGTHCEALWAIDRDTSQLVAYAPEELSELARTDLVVEGSLNGLAVQPGTGTFFTLLWNHGTRHLATIDVGAATVTPVGDALSDSAITSIAFTANGTLYALSESSGATPHTLYSLDPATGAATVVGQLPISFPGSMGLAAKGDVLYLAAGSGAVNGPTTTQDGFFFGTVSTVDAQVTPIPLTGVESFASTVTALAWDAVADRLLLMASYDFHILSFTGEDNLFSSVSDDTTGLAFAQVPMVDYCSRPAACQPATVCTNVPFGAACTCPNCGPASCAEVKAANPEAASGTYDLDLTLEIGAHVTAYCDMDWEGGGWTMIERGQRTDAIPAGFPNATTNGYAPLAQMKAIAAHAYEVAMRDSASHDDFVRSISDTQPIWGFRQGLGMYQNPADFSASDWIGGGAGADVSARLWFDCIGSDQPWLYPTTMYWACDNHEGMHWLRDAATWNYSDSTQHTFELLFR